MKLSPTIAHDESGTIRSALIRHHRRREQGVPTLSVLVGPSETALRTWQDWVGSTGQPPAVVRPIEEAGTGELSPPVGAVLYLNVSERVGAHRLAEFVERLTRFLISQGHVQTRTTIALAVSRADADAYLRDEPHSRARAVFAEGIIDLPPASAAPSDAASARTVVLLNDRSVRPTTVERFQTAAAWQRMISPEGEDETADHARSAAERFLFDLLTDLPDTAGIFQLNVRLGFCFGPMAAEVDLLAADLKLAVEIDGFHHFREPENYRRDRRKDALLQRQGYLVLRFLAEDVVVRLEEILEEVRIAVAFRRAVR